MVGGLPPADIAYKTTPGGLRVFERGMMQKRRRPGKRREIRERGEAGGGIPMDGVRELTVIDELIERFGGRSGVFGAAKALQVSRPALMRWWDLGHIPAKTPHEIVERVERLSGIPQDLLCGRKRYVLPPRTS
jgi:hypothetical protein